MLILNCPDKQSKLGQLMKRDIVKKLVSNLDGCSGNLKLSMWVYWDSGEVMKWSTKPQHLREISASLVGIPYMFATQPIVTNNPDLY